MRLALLGLDETVMALARAGQQAGTDDVVLVCDVENGGERLTELGHVARQPWETLLTGAFVESRLWDAVLVARDQTNEDRRLEQLRKLVQAGVPMLLAHPIQRSMLAYYELDMIRRETGCILVPYLPAKRHPLAQRLLQTINQPGESPLGEVNQIVFERTLAERTKETVSAQFTRDIDLIRFLAGEVARLGAMGSPGTMPSGDFAAYHNLGVQMTGADSRVLRWSVGPADEFSGGRLTVTGSRGKAILIMPEGGSDWRLEIKTGSQPIAIETKAWNPHTEALNELRAELAGQQSISRWPDAARSVELAEAIDRSLLKGRTIELHQEEYSDESTFKGMMTSIGCALLLAALVLMVIAAAVSNLLMRAGALEAARVVATLPYVLLALFGLFLALQLLIKATRRDGGRSAQPAAEESPPGKL